MIDLKHLNSGLSQFNTLKLLSDIVFKFYYFMQKQPKFVIVTSTLFIICAYK